jgi:hypothetical protein
MPARRILCLKSGPFELNGNANRAREAKQCDHATEVGDSITYQHGWSLRYAQDGKNGSRRFACHRYVSAYHLRKLPRDGKTEARYTVLNKF